MVNIQFLKPKSPLSLWLILRYMRPMHRPKSCKQFRLRRNTPINPLDKPPNLNLRKESIHTALQLIRIPRHRCMDISQSQTQLLARVET